MENSEIENQDNIKSNILDKIEKIGNKLPQPINIFIILITIILIISHIFFLMNVKTSYMGINIKTGKPEEIIIIVKSLLTYQGIAHIFNTMVSNFSGFSPLGTVLIAMLGVGVAENTGFLGAILKKMVITAPKKYITFVVVFTGVISNIAADAGIVVLPPLAAALFLALGRHPLVGFAAAFAGQSGGFSANLLLGTVDPLLAGISTEVARMIVPGYIVPATCNWYFMSASTFLIAFAGTFVTEKIIAPRLGEYNSLNCQEIPNISDKLTKLEDKGIKYACLSIVLFLIILALLILPITSPFRLNGSLNNYISKGLVPTIMLFFMIPGVIFGITIGSIKNNKDFSTYLVKSMNSMGGYVALSFFAAQFIAYFSYTNLGSLLAVKGASFLKNIGFTGFSLIISFTLLSGFINLFIGSASAKWAIMAPVFIPILMELGYTPEFGQIAFRIGDSVTNIITPLMPYFALLVAFAQKYDKKIGIGTMISIMIPYSIAFAICWTILLFIWFTLKLPLGPGSFIQMF